MLRILAPLLTALAVLLVSPAQAMTPAAEGYQRSAWASTGDARADHARPSLRTDGCVQRFAVRQAARMAAQQQMFHQDLGPILAQCDLTKVGENVAYGFATGPSVVRAWMRSPGHRANILDRDFRLLGIGARRAKDGTWYAAQVFGRR